jgi:cobalamin biosynthesis protein CobW
MTPRIPVTVVTGFLGAGKTTLLAKLTQEAKPRRLAVLVNEFGEVSIDGALLREHQRGGEVEIHDLANGLVAYGDDSDFLPTMQQILARRGLFDHVLIEASGLALPTAVMEKLQGEELAPHFVLDATLAVVDTPLLLAGEFGHDAHPDSGLGAYTNASVATLFEQQLENADIVVLNKIDALSEDDLLKAEEKVRTLAPAVRFIELAYQARLDPRLTLGLRLHEAAASRPHYGLVQSMPNPGMSPLADQSRLNGHSHSGLAAHTHGLFTHKHFHEQDPGWQSFLLRSSSLQDAETLRRAVADIARAEPILRVKGFAPDRAGRILIQAVRSRAEAQHQPDAAPAKQAQLVFIGYHPSRPRVLELLNQLTGTPWR